MATSPQQPPQGRETSAQIRAQFERSVLAQARANPASFDVMKEGLIRARCFSGIVPPVPQGLPDEDALAWQGYLYRALVQALKNPNDDVFWYWLACWLVTENIREPAQFLPKPVYNRLTKRVRKQITDHLNPSTFYYETLVRIWLPYTEPLLRKVRWLPEQKAQDAEYFLRGLGYDPTAVKRAMSGWKSAVEFTCAWIAERTPMPAKTLRNSYSKFWGPQKLWPQPCSFCDNKARGEFWVEGSSILHCKEHHADLLPKAQTGAWPDKVGRRWWRDNLDILYTLP